MNNKRIRVLWCLIIMLLSAAFAVAISPDEKKKIQEAAPQKPAVEPIQSRKLLIINTCQGFKHSSIPFWDLALKVTGLKSGAYKVQVAPDLSVFKKEILSQYDAICFNNTTNLKLTGEQKKALMDFVKGGKGIVGIHGAADNFKDWPEGMEMMGNVFTGHPWGAGGTWAIKIDDPKHPLTKAFEGKGFQINDEIYRTEPPLYSRDKVRVLVSLDMNDEKTRTAKDVRPDDMDTGISWIQSWGKGRVFYTGFGHTHHTTWNPTLLKHILSGIQFAMGDLDADTTPLGSLDESKDCASRNELTKLMNQSTNYQFGDSRKNLTAIHDLIASTDASGDPIRVLEKELLTAVQGDGSLPFKDFLCRELSIIGSEQAVPVLAEMLNSPETAGMACYALVRNPSKEADKALMDILPTAEPNVQLGIISTLGLRKSEFVIESLRKFIVHDNEEFAGATLSCLGQIGTLKAAKIIEQNMEAIPDSLKLQAYDAVLKCAHSLAKLEHKQASSEIFSGLYTSENPGLIRAAALRGLIATVDNDRQEQLLIKSVSDKDLDVQTTAFYLACELDNRSTIGQIRKAAASYSALQQIRFLGALEETANPLAEEIVIEYLQNDDTGISLAAIQALAVLGSKSSVLPLAQAAANATNRQLRESAQYALTVLSGPQVDSAILQSIQTADLSKSDVQKQTAELIRAIGKRHRRSALPVLLQTAQVQSRSIQRVSLQAIQVIAGPEEIGKLSDILKDNPSSEVEKTVVALADKAEDRKGSASVLLTEYESIQDPKVKAAFFRVLGRIGDPESLTLLRQAVNSKDPILAEGAFRGLVNWPGSEVIQDMKMLTSKGADEKTRILAFRAYLRMVRESKWPDKKQLAELNQAIRLAPRIEEKKAVLGALGGYDSTFALKLAQKYAQIPELKAEAQAAIVSICEKLADKYPEICKMSLQAVLDASPNRTLEKKINELLKKAK